MGGKNCKTIIDKRPKEIGQTSLIYGSTAFVDDCFVCSLKVFSIFSTAIYYVLVSRNLL